MTDRQQIIHRLDCQIIQIALDLLEDKVQSDTEYRKRLAKKLKVSETELVTDVMFVRDNH